ncbi:MAG: ABC transporter permease [Atribacterota bacterium]|jgi:peptide/nickel transport system permease protein|uniref:ABC transporter permease n=1 Tax=Atribacter sp. TaxID=2847780 RepID=UPI002CC3C05A|nr:ABC transporter permease [Atribacterota bacterium]HOT05818.1 ABC transporter permease [Atribacter sp.]
MGVLKDLFKDYRFAVGFILICFLSFLAVASFFSPYDPIEWLQVPRDKAPSWSIILGTNSKGQDVFWEATFAIRNSLIIALIAGLISRVIAVLVGFIAGYKGSIYDRVLMGITDGLLVIPLFLILVLVAMLLREALTLVSTGLLLAFFGWAWDARTIRSQVLSLREREFTLTSVLSGNGTLSLVSKEYLPLTIPLIFSTLINNIAWAIGMEIVLAILGLVSLDIPTLGTTLQWAINYQAMLLGHWWWILTPVILTILLLVALYWFSISVSEYLDPRMRIQRIGAK